MPPSARIVHLSDLHAGSQYFVANLLDRALVEINDLKPDIVVVTGDLTNMGYRQEFREAAEYLARIECPDLLVVPGNHDSRNVGYKHFERIWGRHNRVIRKNGITMVGWTPPSRTSTTGGWAEGYGWLRDSLLERPDDFKIFALHHHLLPIPGTGRERNVVHDAGDVLELLLECGVKLVLSGHKHVPHAWCLEGMHIVNTGTVSTLRLRGDTSLLQRGGYRGGECWSPALPFHGGETIVEFGIDP